MTATMSRDQIAKSGMSKKEQKQARAKARRQMQKRDKVISSYYKPIEDWDQEELARGRQRDANGEFGGRPAKWISRQVHEEAVRRFTDLTQADMRGLVPKAIATVQHILDNDGVDEKGRPYIPPAVRLDAAKWVVEHLVGKPTQRVEADISVKLQGILAHALVQPDGAPAIAAQGWDAEGDVDEEDAELVD